MSGVEEVLRAAGISDKPAEHDSDIHSWRCRYLAPDEPPCDCFAELAADIEALIRQAQAEAWEQGFDAGERDVWEHRQRGFREDDPCIPNPYLAEQ